MVDGIDGNPGDAHGPRALPEYLRSRLAELARQPDAEALMARVRARKEATGSFLEADQILVHRAADRR